jgi:hypothetical protein
VWLWRSALQPAKPLFPSTHSTEFHPDDGHGAPVSSSGNLNIPILELFDSFAPLLDQRAIGIYNPLRTNDWALTMSSRIMRAIALGSSEEEELMMS